ncbi:hypothetical protein Hypma_013147 [Hypsizygus marmoreus]|uniref:Uncharacterized protein n=1 Tax=Hypsizygus marmoreus TaxID=39966 RepID=A0A369JN27_HYPMA|nr:hypothetical protein Hypma_013147 [Hypsizygus marmoreus]
MWCTVITGAHCNTATDMGVSPATIARPLSSVGFSSRKDVSSVPPILVAAYQEAIPGLSAGPIQTGHPPAEDTLRSSNNSLSPGTASPTPLCFLPWLDFEQGTPDVVKPPPLSSSPPGLSSSLIDRSFTEHNTSSEGEFGAVPQQATTNSNGVEIGLRGMVCTLLLVLSNLSILSPEESSFTEITSVVSSHTSKALNFVSNMTNVVEMSPLFELSPGLPAMLIAKSSMDSRYTVPADSTA